MSQKVQLILAGLQFPRPKRGGYEIGDVLQREARQDQVNNANSAFILINCLISQGFQSDSIGLGSPGSPGGPSGPGGLDGSCGPYGDQASQGGPGGQVVRW